MGKRLIEQMLPVLKKMEWPTGPTATHLGYTVYEAGLRKLEEYDTDPSVLAAALKILQSGDSMVYANAGIAATLIAASEEADGTYYQRGLDIAQNWLESAQDAEPELVEVNVWEAYIYIYSERLDDARLILDYLHEQRPRSFVLARAEIAYWQRKHDREQTEEWFDTAIERAPTGPMKIFLREQLGDYYAGIGAWEEALDAYRHAAALEPANGKLWHRMSVICLNLDDVDEADRCNKRAQLSGGPAEAVRQTAMAIARKRGADTNMLRRLFG